MKPIHKFNNGNGATLCHKCSVIISIGLTEDLYCNTCKEKLFSWTSLFDEYGNKLEEPITRLIKDLKTSHIINILNSEYLRLSKEQVDTFNRELKLRNENMDNQ